MIAQLSARVAATMRHGPLSAEGRTVRQGEGDRRAGRADWTRGVWRGMRNLMRREAWMGNVHVLVLYSGVLSRDRTSDSRHKRVRLLTRILDPSQPSRCALPRRRRARAAAHIRPIASVVTRLRRGKGDIPYHRTTPSAHGGSVKCDLYVTNRQSDPAPAAGRGRAYTLHAEHTNFTCR